MLGGERVVWSREHALALALVTFWMPVELLSQSSEL